MSGRLSSPLWYRVAGLRARLRAAVRVRRQRYRDQTWYHLVDSASGQRYRVNAAAYRFVGHLDGRRTVGEIWEALVTRYGDDTLSQDEAIRLLGRLNDAGFVQCELTPDIETLFEEHRRRARHRRWTEINPLSVRIRLFDPARALAAFDPWLRALFCPAAAAAWTVVVVSALLVAAAHWAELGNFAATHVDTPRALMIAWVAYPLIKGVHELAHALAVRRWGGAVHEVGITLFVLVPVPYVDASAASAFPRRTARALVSAAGIMAELLIAALALFVWLAVQPGWMRDTAFVVVVIAAVSTVLFNGNPLLRFDGYHVMCDVLDLPNLDSRSRAWWASAIRRAIFRLSEPPVPTAGGERKWLVLYAPAAWGYRLYIGGLIVLWVASYSTLLAAVIAATLVFVLVVAPGIALMRSVMRTGARQRRRALRIAAIAGVALATSVAVVPVPYGATVPGVVWLPDEAQVRAETEGFVREVMARDGDSVMPGQALATLEDPSLMARADQARARVAALHVRHYHAQQTDVVQARKVAQALAHGEAELERLEQRIAHLEIRSAVAGRAVLTRPEDLTGRFLTQGQLLGHVLAPGELIVRAAVPQEDAALIREQARAASVRLDENPTTALEARLRADVPAATYSLPSPALADRNGGAVPTDPADPEGLRTLQPMFMIDVSLAQEHIHRVGGRAWVRFDLGHAPLALQWARALRQVLLQHFEAS